MPELVGESVGVPELLLEGDTVADGVAEGGASAYTRVLSANTTVFAASMGELKMGCAAAVVYFHKMLPLVLRATMVPLVDATTETPDQWAPVELDKVLLVNVVQISIPVEEFIACTIAPAVTKIYPAEFCVGEAEVTPPRSVAQRKVPEAVSNVLKRVSFAPTGADITIAPSLDTRGLAEVGLSNAADHLTTPVCPTNAYKESLAK